MRAVARDIPSVLLSTAAAAMVVAASIGAAGLEPGRRGALSTGGGIGPAAAGAAVATLAGCCCLGRVAVVEASAGSHTMTGVDRRDLVSAGAVALAAPVTWWLGTGVGLGAVVAAALVGLVADLASDLGVPAYCGAFVGMASPELFGPAAVGAAGLVAGGLFVAADHTFNGFGGKLGTVAFLGCTTVVLGTGTSYPAGGRLAPGVAVAAVVAAALGAAATVRLSVHHDYGPVLGSAAVGLVAGLVCPPLLGPPVAAAVFCASFAGMTRPDRLGPGGVTAAGAVAGLLFAGSAPLFAGSGGKLGTIAFAACLLVDGAARLGERLPVELPAPTT